MIKGRKVIPPTPFLLTGGFRFLVQAAIRGVHSFNMSLLALSLVLLAAFLHAGWNYLAKAAQDTNAFLWWALFFGAIGYGVYIFATATVFLPREVWLLYVVSIGCEVAYLITLVRGYASGELSLVYPLARGSAPILVALWSALFLGERLPALGYMGVGLMVLGIWVVSRQSVGTLDPSPGQRVRNAAVFWALLSSFFVSAYSVLDKIIVQTVPPLVYNFWVYAGIAVAWSPFVWFRDRRKVSRNLSELHHNFARVVVGSLMTVGAYVAVLLALTMTSASYVTAGRGTSVIVGALLGWLALHEGFGRLRVLGATLMVAGLTLMAFA
jgi:drug/metabolite transporter (DMT)-like permease